MSESPRRTALVTGASSGIGRDLALVLAENGIDLVVLARSREALEKLAGECGGVKVRVIAKDLALPGAAGELFGELRGVNIDLLVNNAGFGTVGEFWKVPWEEQDRMMRVNMGALVHLSRLFVPPMVERGFGRVMNVASVAAFVPGPRLGLYCASKAFVVSHSLALRHELRRTGVTVTALCPGPTRTDFQNRAGMDKARLFRGNVMQSMPVARAGFAGMARGKAIVVPGLMNKLAVFAARVLPRTLMARIVGRMNQEG
jgi:short-subunit dehydrogenase